MKNQTKEKDCSRITLEEAKQLTNILDKYDIGECDVDFETLGATNVDTFIKYLPKVIYLLASQQKQPDWVKEWIENASDVLGVLNTLNNSSCELIQYLCLMEDASNILLEDCLNREKMRNSPN